MYSIPIIFLIHFFSYCSYCLFDEYYDDTKIIGLEIKLHIDDYILNILNFLYVLLEINLE